MCMIFGQPVHMMLQGIYPGGGHKAGLTHPASKDLSYSPGLADKTGRPNQDAADGAPQSLIQTCRYTVEKPAIESRILFACHECIKKPGAIEMKFQLVVRTDLFDLLYFFQVITAAPSPVGGILETYQRSTGLVHVIRIDGRRHLLCRNTPPVAFNGPDL